MKSMHAALVIALLIVGLLSACGTQATEAPAAASEVTEVSVEPTQGMTETSAPSDTAVPESSPVPPTNVPATQAGLQPGDDSQFCSRYSAPV